MPRKRRSPEQIVKALQEGEAMLAAGKSDEARRLRELELENRRLKPNGFWRTQTGLGKWIIQSFWHLFD